MRCRFARLVGLLCIVLAAHGRAAEPPPLADYFRAEVEAIAARPLLGIDSAEAWKARRPELQRQLFEMLGLWPLPARTPLDATVTGTVERPDFVIEKVLYQSRPGLYVTGNLYRPKVVKEPLPAILYVCGHSKVEKDGLIYGCKTHYQHHPAWYAANGYVCLIVDTLQLGELPGLHHGTHHLGMWWWQSRGYTPAGVEAWNGIRGIDYLISRPEVDRSKIGVTGRSGGGATSWWVGALDDRVAAVVPVAGITDLQNHVVDGVIEGHCDCMFPVNTARWDFGTLAALVAPKPLLVENTDHDPIFPEDGVRRVYAQLETVYKWLGSSDRLGLVIGKGGHVDSPEIRHPSFAFMDRWLKSRSNPIEEPDRKVPIEELKVLKPGEIPPGNRNDTIHETFVAPAPVPVVPETEAEWQALRARWLDGLKTKVVAGWPETPVPLDLKRVRDETKEGKRLRVFEFTSQAGVRLRLWLQTFADEAPRKVLVRILDAKGWDEEVGKDREPPYPGRPVVLTPGVANAWFAPRGVGPTAWPPAKDTHIRRRFALIGQTLDGMRAWDVRRALAALRALDDAPFRDYQLSSAGDATVWSIAAAVFEPDSLVLDLDEPSATVRNAPALLNLDRVLGMPQFVALLRPRPVKLLVLDPDDPARDPWQWTRAFGARFSAPAR